MPMEGRRWHLLLSVVAACASLALSTDLCYNHQIQSYDARFQLASCEETCTVTPYFSPDHSVDTYVNLIQSATESIDIYTPGFDSWSYCTHYEKECDSEGIGCTLEEQQKEAFPVFPALLNAVHQKKIKVRLLTNNYSQPTAPGKITPLDWFYLNGIQIRFYTTTTFMHSKYMVIDHGKKTSVSSVNFSKTSFTKNREAGVVLEDCSCSMIDFYQSVFEYDWGQGSDYYIDNSYTDDEMKYITDPSTMPITIPPPPAINGAYVTSLKTYTDVLVKRGYTSPDNARDVIFSDLQNVQSSLQVAIYQITDKGLCNQTLSLWQNGVNVSLLVSDEIVSYTDWKEAQDCYGMLYNAGMKGNIQKAFSKFEFSHEKFWIIDGQEVHLSTGNWSPSDFPPGTTYDPYPDTHQSINRDLLIVMNNPDIVKTFQAVFDNDWATGKEWVPKY